MIGSVRFKAFDLGGHETGGPFSSVSHRDARPALLYLTASCCLPLRSAKALGLVLPAG